MEKFTETFGSAVFSCFGLVWFGLVFHSWPIIYNRTFYCFHCLHFMSIVSFIYFFLHLEIYLTIIIHHTIHILSTNIYYCLIIYVYIWFDDDDDDDELIIIIIYFCLFVRSRLYRSFVMAFHINRRQLHSIPYNDWSQLEPKMVPYECMCL